jgi:hypothetical protein
MIETLATYHTRTGKTALIVSRFTIKGRVTYSFTGTLGAGSTGDLASARKRVSQMIIARKGIRHVSGERFHEIPTPASQLELFPA